MEIPTDITSLAQAKELLPQLQSKFSEVMKTTGISETDILEYMKSHPKLQGGAEQLVNMGGLNGYFSKLNQEANKLAVQEQANEAAIAEAGGMDAFIAKHEQQVSDIKANMEKQITDLQKDVPQPNKAPAPLSVPSAELDAPSNLNRDWVIQRYKNLKG